MHHICSCMNSVSRHWASLIFTLGIDKILTDAVLFQRLLPDYKKNCHPAAIQILLHKEMFEGGACV